MADLVRAWRTQAAELRELAAEPQAVALERCAGQREAALIAAADEVLTLPEAVRASGYSDRQLRAMLADGRLTDVGRKRAPRIRRGELPHKAPPARGIAARTGAPYDIGAADAAVNSSANSRPGQR
ncbi:MAG TPA: hypothetical protein VGD56_01270 [Gemmatirosa sp.]